MPVDPEGSLQVQRFAEAVYKKLIEIEETVLQGNKELRSIYGLRIFVRLDIALIWDDSDQDTTKHRYRFVINEVQPGDAGLFMVDQDCRSSILHGFVEGIKRGSLEGY